MHNGGGWAALSIALTGTIACSETVTRRETTTDAVARDRTYVIVTEYKVGEEIPGEGVVRKDNDTKMWVAGVVMMVAGTGAVIGGWKWSVTPGNDLNDFSGTLVAVAGGVPLAGAGIILTIVGLVPRVFVEKSVGALRFTPVAGPHYGGGALQLEF
jgi:hypothetical protein